MRQGVRCAVVDMFCSVSTVASAFQTHSHTYMHKSYTHITYHIRLIADGSGGHVCRLNEIAELMDQRTITRMRHQKDLTALNLGWKKKSEPKEKRSIYGAKDRKSSLLHADEGWKTKSGNCILLNLQTKCPKSNVCDGNL